MADREQYDPGPARGAQVRKDGEKWTLVLVRELRHSPEKVWQALTDPAHLREWAPFDADGSLGAIGTVKLTWVGKPTPEVSETKVTRADAPKVLEYSDIRWKLEAFGGGTRLTLWHNIDRRFISMGAAGWHICFDVLDRLLSGTPMGRIVGGEAMKFDWPRLNSEYAKQFDIELELRLEEEEVDESCQIQLGLLPKTIPQLTGYAIAGESHPARVVGGDYFDVLRLSESRVALCIADASGKGMPAALMMSNLQAAVRALASENLSPPDLCAKLNRVVWSNFARDKFVTLFYALLDGPSGHLAHVNAGHNAPVVVRRRSRILRLEAGGTILGAFRDSLYQRGTLVLEPGDLLVAFTDGVSECMNALGEEWGEHRLVDTLESSDGLAPDEIIDQIMKGTHTFAAGSPQFDDMTLLVLQRQVLSAARPEGGERVR